MRLFLLYDLPYGSLLEMNGKWSFTGGQSVKDDKEKMAEKNLMKKLIIFDCDGVLVDSEIIANRIDAELLTQHGYCLTTKECIKPMSTKLTF